MLDNPTRKKSSCQINRRYEQNKQNVGQPRDAFAVNKDILEKLAQEELNNLSQVDFKKTDYINQHRAFAQDITGWNHPPRIIHKSKKDLKLKPKPKSASKTRGVVLPGSRMPSLEGRHRMRLKTTTAVEASSDQVFVCKPLTTQPTQRVDNNFILDHRPIESVVLKKPREDPSKLYNIIKAIERENSKLLKKLFSTKPSFRQYQSKSSKRVTAKSITRPTSSIRKSKENIQRQDFKNNTDTMLNFVLCSHKDFTPNNTLRTTKPDLKSIRKFAFECSDSDNFIFYSEKNPISRFLNKPKIPNNDLVRYK